MNCGKIDLFFILIKKVHNSWDWNERFQWASSQITNFICPPPLSLSLSFGGSSKNSLEILYWQHQTNNSISTSAGVYLWHSWLQPNMKAISLSECLLITLHVESTNICTKTNTPTYRLHKLCNIRSFMSICLKQWFTCLSLL